MTSCRFCGTSLTSDNDYLVLPDCPLTDQFLPNSHQAHEYISNIQIHRCSFCGLVQNPSNIDFRQYYEEYEYSSALSPHTQLFMEQYCELALSSFKAVHKEICSYDC